MRDPEVYKAAKKVAAAIDEAEQFLTARRQWLDATPYDWSDVDKRAETILRLGFPMRYSSPSGHITVEIRSKQILPLSDAERELIFKRLVKPEPLPRGRGRPQAGAFIPRDVAIVQAIKHIHQRYGFPAIGGEQKTKKPSAAAIVRNALQRLGVTLSKRTIDNIWSNRVVPL